MGLNGFGFALANEQHISVVQKPRRDSEKHSSGEVPPSAPKKCLTKYPRIQDDMWKLSRLKLKNAQALLSKFRSKLEAKTKCEITEKIV